MTVKDPRWLKLFEMALPECNTAEEAVYVADLAFGQVAARLSTDALGLEHRGKGDGGGQFVKKGGGDSGGRRKKLEAAARDQGYEDDDFKDLSDDEMNRAFSGAVKDEPAEQEDRPKVTSVKKKIAEFIEKNIEKMKVSKSGIRDRIEDGESPDEIMESIDHSVISGAYRASVKESEFADNNLDPEDEPEDMASAVVNAMLKEKFGDEIKKIADDMHAKHTETKAKDDKRRLK